MRVLCFGDSIAQGFWSVEGGWVEKLRKHYDRNQMEDVFNKDEPTIFNLGISGDITEGVIKRFKNELEARRWFWPHEEYCLVFAIGINDSVVIDGTERSMPEKYGQQLQQLIDAAKGETNKLFFVGLTPVDESTANGRPGKPKAFSNERIIEFDNVLEDICNNNQVPYLKVFNEIKSKIDANERLFDDGLHPNDAGHQFIFELVHPELDKLLEN